MDVHREPKERVRFGGGFLFFGAWCGGGGWQAVFVVATFVTGLSADPAHPANDWVTPQIHRIEGRTSQEDEEKVEEEDGQERVLIRRVLAEIRHRKRLITVFNKRNVS